MYTLKRNRKKQWVIYRPDGDVLYTLKPEDEAFARETLDNLNAGGQ